MRGGECRSCPGYDASQMRLACIVVPDLAAPPVGGMVVGGSSALGASIYRTPMPRLKLFGNSGHTACHLLDLLDLLLLYVAFYDTNLLR